ncbi:IPTL-CTERM sorting domain-containing protein [Paracidovorax sp. MALMAid1276]|uniref:IPTL-CTERM sorting domain-containing protein n=1 Tax=Paracidovorax sp. MALMAid1276 TaxID=3411631 RepID=UPI003B99A1FE
MKIRHLLALLLMVASSWAHAVFTINFTETGGNVVMTGSGSINTTGMTLIASPDSCSNGAVDPTTFCLGVSPTGLVINNAVSPALTSLTTGGTTIGNASSGAPVFLSGSTLYLPTGYTSGAALSGSATFNGRTFASMGLTAGTRTLNLTSGDSIVINIGPVAAAATTTAAIPTLGEYGVMALASLMAMAGIVVMRRRRKD